MTWEDKLIEDFNSGSDYKAYRAAVRISKNDTGSNSRLEYEMADVIIHLLKEKYEK